MSQRIRLLESVADKAKLKQMTAVLTFLQKICELGIALSFIAGALWSQLIFIAAWRTYRRGKHVLPWVFLCYIIANVLQAIAVAELQLCKNWTLTVISHEILR